MNEIRPNKLSKLEEFVAVIAEDDSSDPGALGMKVKVVLQTSWRTGGEEVYVEKATAIAREGTLLHLGYYEDWKEG